MNLIEYKSGWEFLFSNWMLAMAWQVAVLVVVLVVVTRWCLPWASARFKYGLWMLVPIRLVLPPTLALATGWGWWLLPERPADKFMSQVELEAQKQPSDYGQPPLDGSDFRIAADDEDRNPRWNASEAPKHRFALPSRSPNEFTSPDENESQVHLLAEKDQPLVSSQVPLLVVEQPPTQPTPTRAVGTRAPGTRAIANDGNANISHKSEPLAEMASSSNATIETTNPERSTLPAWLMPIWLLGFIFFMLRLVRAQMSLLRVVKDSIPAQRAIQALLQTACEKLGVRQQVTVRRTDRIGGPVLAGLWRPVILISHSFETELEAEEQLAIFVHELQHLRRRDLWVHYIETFLRSVYWFHPAVWWAVRETRRFREMACDEATVFALAGRRRDYGLGIVKLAESMITPSPSLSLPVLASRRDLRIRIQRILDPRMTSGQSLSIPAMAMVVIAALVLVPSAGRTGQINTIPSEPSPKVSENLPTASLPSLPSPTVELPNSNHPVIHLPQKDTPDWSAFVKICDRIMSTSTPEPTDFMNWRGFISQSQQTFLIEQYFSKIESQDKDTASYWERRGFLQHSLDDLPAAIESYQVAIKYHPEKLPLRLLCLRCQLVTSPDIKAVIQSHSQQIKRDQLQEFCENVLAFLEVAQIDYLQKMAGLEALFDHVDTLDPATRRKQDWLAVALTVLIIDHERNHDTRRYVFTPSAENEARRRLHDRWVALAEQIDDCSTLAFSAWFALRQFDGTLAETPVTEAVAKAETCLLSQESKQQLSNPFDNYDRAYNNLRETAKKFSPRSPSYELRAVRPLLPRQHPLDYLARHYGMQGGVDSAANAKRILDPLNQQGRQVEARDFELRFRLYRLEPSEFTPQVEIILSELGGAEIAEWTRKFESIIEVWNARQSDHDLAAPLAKAIGRHWRAQAKSPQDLLPLLSVYGRYCAMAADRQDQALLENTFREVAEALMGPLDVQSQTFARYLEVIELPDDALPKALEEPSIRNHHAYQLFLKLLTERMEEQGPMVGSPDLAWQLIREFERCYAYHGRKHPSDNRAEGRVAWSSIREYPFYLVRTYWPETELTNLIRLEPDHERIIKVLERTPFLKTIDHFDQGLVAWQRIFRQLNHQGFPSRFRLNQALKRRENMAFGTRLLLLRFQKFDGFTDLPTRAEVYDLLLNEIDVFEKLPSEQQRRIATFIDEITDDGMSVHSTWADPVDRGALVDHPVAKLISQARAERKDDVWRHLMRARDFDELGPAPHEVYKWASSSLFHLVDQDPGSFIEALVHLAKLMRGGTTQAPMGALAWGSGRKIDIDHDAEMRKLFEALSLDKGKAKAIAIFCKYAEHPETQWFHTANMMPAFFAFKLNEDLPLDQTADALERTIADRLTQLSDDLAAAFGDEISPMMLLPFFNSVWRLTPEELDAVAKWAEESTKQNKKSTANIARLWELAVDLRRRKLDQQNANVRLSEPNQSQQAWMKWIVNPKVHKNTRWALALTLFLNDSTLPVEQARQCLALMGDVIENETIQSGEWITAVVTELNSRRHEPEFQRLASALTSSLANAVESGKYLHLTDYQFYPVFQSLHETGERDSIRKIIARRKGGDLNIHSEALLIELGYAEFLAEHLQPERWKFRLDEYLRFVKTGKLRFAGWNSHAFTANLEANLPNLLAIIPEPGLQYAAEVYYSSLPDSLVPELQPKVRRADRLRGLAGRFSEQTFTQPIENGLVLVLLFEEPESRDLIAADVEKFAQTIPFLEVWKLDQQDEQNRILLAGAAASGLLKSDPGSFLNLVRHAQAGSANQNSGAFDTQLSQMLTYFLKYTKHGDIPEEVWPLIETELATLKKIAEKYLRSEDKALLEFRSFGFVPK
ncbi:MAG: M56 family metallopeptidase [Pirellulaceae bacterium]|nr:M56 family metallopeptidase [Pirellulaceae bacterium]